MHILGKLGWLLEALQVVGFERGGVKRWLGVRLQVLLRRSRIVERECLDETSERLEVFGVIVQESLELGGCFLRLVVVQQGKRLLSLE